MLMANCSLSSLHRVSVHPLRRARRWVLHVYSGGQGTIVPHALDWQRQAAATDELIGQFWSWKYILCGGWWAMWMRQNRTRECRARISSDTKSTWLTSWPYFSLSFFFFISYCAQKVSASFLQIIDVNMHLLALEILPKPPNEAHIKWGFVKLLLIANDWTWEEVPVSTSCHVDGRVSQVLWLRRSRAEQLLGWCPVKMTFPNSESRFTWCLSVVRRRRKEIWKPFRGLEKVGFDAVCFKEIHQLQN